MTLRSTSKEFRFPIPIMLGVEYMLFIFFERFHKMYNFTISYRDVFFSGYNMEKVETTFTNSVGKEEQYLVDSIELAGLVALAPYGDIFVFAAISYEDCCELSSICEENNWNYDMFES